jgi:hypothetical protein
MGINFAEYAETNNHPLFNSIYKVLARRQEAANYCGDGETVCSHTGDDINEVRDLLYTHSLSSRVAAGEAVKDLATARAMVTDEVLGGLKKLHQGLALDAIQNPISNIGVYGIDPQRATYATIPLSLTPYEATAIYASGGIPKNIIDRKSRGIVKNGITFKTTKPDFWNEKRIEELVNEAHRTGMFDVNMDALRDDAIYGGAFLYPVFKKDSAFSFSLDLDMLMSVGVLEKDCIDHFAEVDRWNTVFVPRYDPTAADYLHPSHIYIPISGVNVCTERAALLRARRLPYWGALYQIGWGMSDFEGWYTASLAYDITAMCMPIMAQQMSLILYQMPMDAISAQLDRKTIDKVIQTNEAQLREWSINNPKAVNALGEIKTIDRTFSGFDKFMDAIITDLTTRADIPRPAIFWTPSKGFTSNSEDTVVAESDMVRTRQIEIEPFYKNLTKILVVHCFGADSEEYKNLDKINLSFDNPIMSTPKDMAEISARFSASVNSLKQAGIPQKEALELSKQFFPSIRISPEVLKAAEEAYKLEVKTQEESIKAQKMSAQNKGANGRPAATNHPMGAKPGKAPKASPSQTKDGVLERLKAFFRRDLTDGEIGSILEAEDEIADE